MDNEFDEAQFWRLYKGSQAKFEEFSRELIRVRVSVLLGGFRSSNDQIEIAPEFRIEKLSSEAQKEFLERTRAFGFTDYSMDDMFAAIYEFEIQRRDVQGSVPSESIKRLSMFFSVVTRNSVSTTKGHLFVLLNGSMKSIGYASISDHLHHPKPHIWNAEDENQLRTIWPLFMKEYGLNRQFSLVSRRYYYSRTRREWQDRLIDLMIALEALLIPENFGTKADKLARRLALLLGSGCEQEEVVANTKAGYALRNAVVHGDSIEDDAQSLSIVDAVAGYTRMAMQVFLVQYAGLDSKTLVGVLEGKDLEG